MNETSAWANKVRETANGIAKCARNSFAIPLPTGRLHDVGTVGGGQDVTFTRARVIGAGPSAADSAKPTSVRVTGFPGIAPSTVDRLTSATIGFNFSNGVTGGSDSAQLIIETNATRFTSVSCRLQYGQCNDYRLLPRRTGTSPSRVIGPRVGLVAAKSV
jgi:hypothetical protein